MIFYISYTLYNYSSDYYFIINLPNDYLRRIVTYIYIYIYLV